MSTPRIKKRPDLAKRWWDKVQWEAAKERSKGSEVAAAITAALAAHPEWECHTPSQDDYMNELMEQQIRGMMGTLPSHVKPKACALCSEPAVTHDVCSYLNTEGKVEGLGPYGLCQRCVQIPNVREIVARRSGRFGSQI